jgi:hypothetical protein
MSATSTTRTLPGLSIPSPLETSASPLIQAINTWPTPRLPTPKYAQSPMTAAVARGLSTLPPPPPCFSASLITQTATNRPVVHPLLWSQILVDARRRSIGRASWLAVVRTRYVTLPRRCHRRPASEERSFADAVSRRQCRRASCGAPMASTADQARLHRQQEHTSKFRCCRSGDGGVTEGDQGRPIGVHRDLPFKCTALEACRLQH